MAPHFAAHGCRYAPFFLRLVVYELLRIENEVPLLSGYYFSINLET
jgi:hypothetical protein